MATKLDEDKKPILKRKVITLEEKIKILDLLKSGEKQAIVAKIWNLNESTIRTIKQNEQKIRNSVISGSIPSTKRVSRVRDTLIEKMEKSLVMWIHECNEKKVHLSGNLIKLKALYIYENLKQIEKPDENSQHEFRASTGWFEKFRKRHCLHNNKLQEEYKSTDINPVRKFPQDLLEIIKEGGYSIEEFSGMTENEIRELIDEEINLNEENLVQLLENDKPNTNDEDSYSTEDSDCVEPKKEFSIKELTEGLNLAQKLMNYFTDNDPSTKRSETFIRQLNSCLAPYYELKQSLFNDFLTKESAQIPNDNNVIHSEQVSNNNDRKLNVKYIESGDT